MNTHIIMHRVAGLLIIAFLLPAQSKSQSNGTIDFGCGYMATNFSSVLLFEKPSRSSKRVARIDLHVIDRVQSDSLVFLLNRSSVPLFPRTIEVVHNDVYGLPILSFSPDSAWAQISLDCRETLNPASAWLNVRDARNDNVQLELWSAFFKTDEAVVFRDSCPNIFFTQPNESTRAFPVLTEDQNEPDYCMRVIKKAGHWMQVYLESPSTFMTDPEERHERYKSPNAPPKLWIRYLDDSGRPLIWYLWD